MTGQSKVRELLADVERGRAEWDAAVAGLPDPEYAGEVYRGWTVKDILAHLVTYTRLNVRHLDAYAKRHKLASMRARNYYQFNKREVARNKQAALPELRSDLDAALRELVERVRTLDDEDLRATFPSPWSVNSTRQVRLASVLRADVSRHFREHARDVRRWREQQASAPPDAVV